VAVTRLRTKRSGLRLASERLLAEEAERERDARHPASAAVLVVRREPVDPAVRAARVARADSADGSHRMTVEQVVQMQAQASVEYRKNAVPVAQARAVDRPDGIPANALPYVQPRAQVSIAKAKAEAVSVVNPNSVARPGIDPVQAQLAAAGSVDPAQADASRSNAAEAASAVDRRAADSAAAKPVADSRVQKDRPVVAEVAAAGADRRAADKLLASLTQSRVAQSWAGTGFFCKGGVL
jgi:hypothetical protein